MQTHRLSPGAAFTLIELMVSMTVLVLLVVLVNQLVFNTNATTANSRKHMDADNQARLIFDRMANDFGKMLKRPDVDYLFYKQAGSSTGTNDKLFFYSEAPAYFAATGAGSAATTQSNTALVGYRIHANPDPNDPQKTRTIPQLERLGQGLTWDTKTTNNATATTPDAAAGGVVFLGYQGGSGIPLPTTTISGNWSATIGTLANHYDDGLSPNYHVLGDQVFRMECAFLTKDGNVSTKPLRQVTPANWPSGAIYYSESATDPSASSDAAANFSVGSRWYNTTTGRGYVCGSAAVGAAVWSAIGIQDIAAIVVALGILDATDRSTLTDANALTPLLLDPTETQVAGSATPPAAAPMLMASIWSATVNSAGFGSAAGVTRAAASQVRIYQRFFYLNTP